MDWFLAGSLTLSGLVIVFVVLGILIGFVYLTGAAARFVNNKNARSLATDNGASKGKPS